MTKNDINDKSKGGRPPTANRSREVQDAMTRGDLDGRSATTRKVRRFKAEMKAELAFDAWGNTEDLNLRLAGSFYARLLPTTVLMHTKVYDVLANRYEVTRRATGTIDERIAEVIGVQNLVLAYGLENTAQEGQPAVWTPVHSTNVYIFYRPPTPGIMVPTWGYQPRMRTPRRNAQDGISGSYRTLNRG